MYNIEIKLKIDDELIKVQVTREGFNELVEALQDDDQTWVGAKRYLIRKDFIAYVCFAKDEEEQENECACGCDSRKESP